MRYPEIEYRLYKQLLHVPASAFAKRFYYPCSLVMKSGEVLERVYVWQEDAYFDLTRIWPDEKGKRPTVPIEDVAEIHDSPWRLPSQFANVQYALGETGPTYYSFTVDFDDGTSQGYFVGSGHIDFPDYPDGKSAKNVMGVRYNTPADDKRSARVVPARLCLFSGYR